MSQKPTNPEGGRQEVFCHKGAATLVNVCKAFGRSETKVSSIQVTRTPYAQYPRALEFYFKLTGKRRGVFMHVTPDDTRYCQVRVGERVVFDSRSEIAFDATIPSHLLTMGTRVRHETYGLGVVAERKEEGKEVAIAVQFQDGTSRTFFAGGVRLEVP